MHKKGMLLLGATLCIAAFFAFDLHHLFTLESMQAKRMQWLDVYTQHPLLTCLAYFVLYVLMAALSLPGAALMTLMGGALFGVVLGTMLVSFASTIGGSLAFLASRYLFRDMIEQRYAGKLTQVNAGIQAEGTFYVFAMRLIPIIPYFLINLVMGLTSMPLRSFYWVSQLGMLPFTFVYVLLGQSLASISSLRDLVAPQLLIALMALGILPLCLRRMVAYFRNKS